MSYANTANRANPLAVIGALGVPAGFGAVLIAGLAVTAVIQTPPKNPIAQQYTAPPIEMPLDPIEPVDDPASSLNTAAQTQQQQIITRPPSDMTWQMGPTAPVNALPEFGNGLGMEVGPLDFGIPEPRPTPLVEPIAASPRGNPGSWISNSDYRPSWINRGFEGIAQFTLDIDAAGRVKNCTITGSTGYVQLDRATCDLLSRRAKFDPAKDTNGAKVSGRFSSSVRWTIPE